MNFCPRTVKPVLSGHSKTHKKLVSKTDYRLMLVKSIAECSPGAFCIFDLHYATICHKNRLILHTPGPEIRQHVAYIYIDTPCAYPPSYPSIRYA